MNVVMVYLNQQTVFVPHNSYAMEVDQENRNCYNYREFGYIARHCRNRGIEGRIEEEKRLEYRGNENNEQ